MQISIFAALLLTTTLAAQPDILWQNTFGGSSDDFAYDIQHTNDGGYIVAGSTKSTDGDVSNNHGKLDFWVLKISNSGALQWQKSFGGSMDDIANSVQQTNDGGYIVAGITKSSDGDVSGFHGEQDIWVIKLSNSGALQWQKTLGGNGTESFAKALQITEGGYIVAATTYSTDGDVSGNHGGSDLWIVKLTDTGGFQWQKSFGGSATDGALDICLTMDGGFIVAGGSNSSNGDVPYNYGNGDSWIIKLNSIGDIQWQKVFGGSDTDVAMSLMQTSDGGYIVANTSDSDDGDVSENHGQSDFWVQKLSSIGDVQWKVTLGGSLEDRARSIQQTSDGGYIVAGDTRSYDVPGHHGTNTYDLWVLKLTDTGTLQWSKTLGGNSHEVAGYTILQSIDGGYVITGTALSNDGDVSGNHGINDLWVVKLGGDPVDVKDIIIPANAESIEVFPNPAAYFIYLKISSDAPTMTIRISDMQGRQLIQQTLPNGGSLDISSLPNGLYSVSATTTSGLTFSNKFRKQG